MSNIQEAVAKNLRVALANLNELVQQAYVDEVIVQYEIVHIEEESNPRLIMTIFSEL